MALNINLFIIGNGFDLGHKLKTTYGYFKKWLIWTYPKSKNTDNFMVSDATLMPKGELVISDEDLASFLVYCINEATGGNWENFEEALGKIEWELFFDQIDDVIGRDGEVDLWKTAYNREDFTSTLHLNADGFSKIFSQWINTISYPRCIACNSFLTDTLKASSIFLTFNYTKTLENIYNIQPTRICHIHGIQGGEIIIGHGIEKSSLIIDDNSDDNYDYESVYDFGMEGLDGIHNTLRKRTQQIAENNPFFSNLKFCDIKNIFSWGFSFSEVDLYYIREICAILDTETITWNLHEWGNSDLNRFEQILRQSGFKGSIESFKA